MPISVTDGDCPPSMLLRSEKPEHVVLFRLDLHQRVRQVHGRRQYRIGDTGHHERTGECTDQPFLIDQTAEYAEKINTVLIVITGADY